jgi:hypothetical protein
MASSTREELVKLHPDSIRELYLKSCRLGGERRVVFHNLIKHFIAVCGAKSSLERSLD